MVFERAAWGPWLEGRGPELRLSRARRPGGLYLQVSDSPPERRPELLQLAQWERVTWTMCDEELEGRVWLYSCHKKAG